MEYCRRIVCDSGCSLNNTKEVLIRSTAEATLPGSATILLANFDGQVIVFLGNRSGWQKLQ